MITYTFNRFLVIESLNPDEDYLSGTELAKYLTGLQQDAPIEFKVEYKSARGRDDLLEILTQEVERAKGGDFPVLHIESHGFADGSGLALADGSAIKWEEMTSVLAPLNLAMSHNLLVCVAACFGLGGANMIRANIPAPCFALIAPDHEVNGPELHSRFMGFYRVLIETLDTQQAFFELTSESLEKGRFHAIGAHDWFFRQVIDFLTRYCTNEPVELRIQDIIEASKADLGQDSYEEIAARAELRNKNFVDDVFRTFFMIDKIPANAARYSPILLKAKLFAKTFFDREEQLKLHTPAASESASD